MKREKNMSSNKRTATIIIGIIGIIASIIILYFAISALVSVSSDPDPYGWRKPFQILLIVVIEYCSLYGAVKRSRLLLLSWLICFGVGCCIEFALCIYSSKPIAQFISLGISSALWAVILRFYMELFKNREQGVQQQEAEANH